MSCRVVRKGLREGIRVPQVIFTESKGIRMSTSRDVDGGSPSNGLPLPIAKPKSLRNKGEISPFSALPFILYHL